MLAGHECEKDRSLNWLRKYENEIKTCRASIHIHSNPTNTTQLIDVRDGEIV